ncbi:MAG TPA: ferritin-like domain-containing protein [Ktedonobacterales bacterium]|nr:ferritin-like domain-containing protein [Ktedonobacterales bacterium]
MTSEVTEAIVAEVNATMPGTAEGMHRYYELAKRQAWEIRDLSWGDIAPVPEGHGSAIQRARRQAMWRSVVTQQLQADMIAVEFSTQLLRDSPDYEAKLYYTTMAQDESRHMESWLLLSREIGGVCEPDPFLEKLGKLTMNLASLEEQIWLFQVAFEGLVIPRFRQIAAAAPNTILAEICRKLQVDDGIHHGSGVCYEQILLAHASAKTKQAIARVSHEMWPLYVEHIMWRPRERAWASATLRSRDAQLVAKQREDVIALGSRLGIEVDLSY